MLISRSRDEAVQLANKNAILAGNEKEAKDEANRRASENTELAGKNNASQRMNENSRSSPSSDVPAYTWSGAWPSASRET